MRSTRTPSDLYAMLPMAAYTLWALVYIWKSSFVAADGTRYFCLFDDAMISARYAWNLVQGHGLVWNPGEYVEGYTNLLWVLVMAPLMAVFGKVTSLLMVQGVGLMVICANAWLVGRILVNVGAPKAPAAPLLMACGVALGLGYYPLSYFSLTGMETGLMTLLVSAATWLALLSVDSGDARYRYAMALALGLAFMTRPDAALYTPIIYAYCLFGVWRSHGVPAAVKALVGPSLTFLVFFCGMFLFRHFYYGEWFPNTYTLKVVGAPLDARLANGWIFIGYFLREVGVWIALAVAAVAFRFDAKRALLLAMFVALLAYQVWNGGDAWFLWRMNAPTVPFLLGLVVLGGIDLWHWLAARRGQPAVDGRGLGIAMVVMVAVMLVSVNGRFLPEMGFQRAPSAVKANRNHVNVALMLNDLLKEDATIGVFWAGVIPYFTERYAIDFLGKADKRIARLEPDFSGAVGREGLTTVPGHNKYDLDYSIRQLQPDYIQGYNWGRQNLERWVAPRYRNLQAKNGASALLKLGSDQVRWEKLGGPRPGG